MTTDFCDIIFLSAALHADAPYAKYEYESPAVRG